MSAPRIARRPAGRLAPGLAAPSADAGEARGEVLRHGEGDRLPGAHQHGPAAPCERPAHPAPASVSSATPSIELRLRTMDPSCVTSMDA